MWTYVDIQENNKQIDLERGVIDPVPLDSINNPTIVVDFQETFSNVVELMLTSIKQWEKPWKNILSEKNHEKHPQWEKPWKNIFEKNYEKTSSVRKTM